jgi:hypothetical protein
VNVGESAGVDQIELDGIVAVIEWWALVWPQGQILRKAPNTWSTVRGQGWLVVATIGVVLKAAGTQGGTGLPQLAERMAQNDSAARAYGCGQSSIGESAP